MHQRQHTKKNLVAEWEESATHPERLRLWKLQSGDNALAHMRDVEVGSLRTEPGGFSVRIRVQVAQQRRCVVDLSIWNPIEPRGIATAYGLWRQGPIVHDHVGPLDARVYAAEKVGHFRAALSQLMSVERHRGDGQRRIAHRVHRAGGKQRVKIQQFRTFLKLSLSARGTNVYILECFRQPAFFNHFSTNKFLFH